MAQPSSGASGGIEAELLLEGQGSAKVVCAWDDGAALEAQKAFVQPKGKPKTSLQALGWKDALVSYRPFLSYNELGSMLDEGPSKLYDALSLVLGLEDLVNAQAALAKSRLERQQAWDAADGAREALVELLKALLEQEADDRASVCLEALTSKSWGLDGGRGGGGVRSSGTSCAGHQRPDPRRCSGLRRSGARRRSRRRASGRRSETESGRWKRRGNIAAACPVAGGGARLSCRSRRRRLPGVRKEGGSHADVGRIES